MGFLLRLSVALDSHGTKDSRKEDCLYRDQKTKEWVIVGNTYAILEQNEESHQQMAVASDG